MAETFYGAAKQEFMEGFKDKVFGQGLLGKSLRTGFDAKFGKQEIQQDTNPYERENVSVLKRIEVVVTNISDNIYNIAGVLNAQLTSMKETEDEIKRQEMERLIAKEEQSLEAGSNIVMQTPKVEQKKQDNKGIFDSVNKGFALFKNSISKFAKGINSLLKSKKFIALAGVAAVGGAAAYAAIKDKDQTLEQDPEQQEAQQQSSGSLTLNVPETKSQEQASTTPSPSPSAQRQQSSGSLTLNVPETKSQEQASTTPSPSPSAQSAPNISSMPSPNITSVFELARQKEAEKFSIVQKLLAEKKYSGSVPADAPELQELDKKYEAPMIQAMMGQNNSPNVSVNMNNMMSKEINQNFPSSSNKIVSMFNNLTSQGSPSLSMSMGGSSSSETSNISLGGMSSNESSTPIFSSPSVGSSVNQASTNLQAMDDQTSFPSISNVDNSSSNVLDSSMKPRNKIPPPVANRGSLDNYSFFNG
ncbi:hypothetical protein EB118_02935 [bacterium]|nr:hypothetical protein [bacterium]